MTQSLPPQQPATLSYSSADYGGLSIREVARYQRCLINCILAYILCYVLAFAVHIAPVISLLLVFCGFAAGVTGAVFVFMLAIKLYGVGGGVVLGILTLIPLIGLIALLIVNGKATGILKKHGIPVGLLGAKMSAVP